MAADRRRTTALLFALAMGLGGCGISLFSGSRASVAAHTVFLARPGCTTFVARTLDVGFSVLEAADGSIYVPAPGDVLEGPAREGRSVFRFFPADAVTLRDEAASVPLDVQALDIPLAAARARLDAACGP